MLGFYVLIRFSKTRHGPALVCTRDDGSIAGMKDRRHGAFFVRHDLMHYVVETSLGFRQAFLGMLAGLDGNPPWSIDAFNAKGVSKRLPAQAIIAEYIVGQLDLVVVPHDGAITADDLNNYLRQALHEHPAADELPTIAQVQIDAMLRQHADLYGQYRALLEGEHLDLQFP